MFSRINISRISQFSYTIRSYKPPIRDSGYFVSSKAFERSSQVETITVTDDTFDDVFDRDNKIPFLVYCKPGNKNIDLTPVKNHIETTHGKINFALFDYENNQLISKRFKMQPNQLAIINQGTLLTKSDTFNSEKDLFDFITRYAWVLNH